LALLIDMHLSVAERLLLQRLADVGGRYKFGPDGRDRSAYAAFNRDVVSLLRSLESKGLIEIDRQRSRAIGLHASGCYASVTVQLTAAGRTALL
jgi:hypothetical protein